MSDQKLIIGYYRLSMEDDSEGESNSIINQRKLVKDYISNIPELVAMPFQEFYDDGYSGSSMERPAIKQVLELARENKVQCIVVKDFSRFARNYIEMGTYLEQIFPFLGVRFISISDRYDSKDYKGKSSDIEVQFKGLIADFYVKDQSVKVKAAVSTRRGKGEYCWGDEFGAHFVGTGPFMMKEWKTDEAVEFVRSENFWGGDVYLDGLNFVYITDINQRVNALKNGDIDIACDLAGEGIEEIKADNNLVMSQEPGMGVNYIYFNMENGPTADIKVRKALQMAVDRDAMCAALYQYGECSPAYLPLPPASWGYDESLEDLVPKYDVEGAKKLLAEAGYPEGFELEYYTSDSASSKKIGEILQQFCAKVNVKVNIHQASWGTFSEIGASGNADAIGMSWTWFPDPYFYLNKMFHEESLGTLGNGQQFNIPEVNELLDKAVEVSDQEERAKLYKEALKLIVEQYPQIDYCLANINTGLNKKVQNYVVRPDKTIEIAGDGHNVWLAK